ncbi:MAG: spore cortex biosynthesis protein YabQ [Oscillospiraceae bacterium]
MELETFFSVSQQTQLFLLSCLAGIPLGILWDIFRVIRTVFPHNTLLVIIEDALYMLIYAVFMTTFTIVMARGDYRFFYTIGNVLGFALYFFTVGNVILGVIRRIFGWIKSALFFISMPVKKIYKKINDKSEHLYSNNTNFKKKKKIS